MRWRIRSAAALAAAALTGTLGVAAARADGLPVLSVDVGGTGVRDRASGDRYVAFAARRETVVARVTRDGGRIRAWTFLAGRFTIPAVAYDGSPDGLSADGRTLVLIRPRQTFPQARTSLAIVDAKRLRPRGVVTLAGDFSFDAVSPSGRTVYLIQYLSARDPNRYAVRAYDLRARRLLPRPVVDPREPGEAMGGRPVTRATSPDGRWAYTLYDQGRGHPFIHALDTARREARCIDLPASLHRGRNVSRLRLAVDDGGRTVTVRDRDDEIAAIDTTTWGISIPSAAGASFPAPEALLALGAALVAGAGLLLVARRRRTVPA